MGSLGDRVVQGQASGSEMRTTPLWGLRALTRYLHDGSARSLEDAIRRHDGQGRSSREQVDLLEPERLSALLAFLRSL